MVTKPAVTACSLPPLQGNPKFLEAVASWQKKLGTVDLVLNVWKDVQRKWQALEAIFIGSADIRVQLPEDSKRFDAVNADYVASCWTGSLLKAQGGYQAYALHVLRLQLCSTLLLRVPPTPPFRCRTS